MGTERTLQAQVGVEHLLWLTPDPLLSERFVPLFRSARDSQGLGRGERDLQVRD